MMGYKSAVRSFLGLGIAAVIAAGCGNGSMGPGPTAMQNQSVRPASHVHFNGNQCQGNSCGYRLVAPLTYDGSEFTSAPQDCHGTLRLSDAPAYTAPSTTGLLFVDPTFVTPPCAGDGNALRPFTRTTSLPTPTPEPIITGDLYIVAFDVTGGGHGSAIMVAGAADPASNPWMFGPAPPGVTVQGGDTYVFFVAALAHNNHGN